MEELARRRKKPYAKTGAIQQVTERFTNPAIIIDYRAMRMSSARLPR